MSLACSSGGTRIRPLTLETPYTPREGTMQKNPGRWRNSRRPSASAFIKESLAPFSSASSLSSYSFLFHPSILLPFLMMVHFYCSSPPPLLPSDVMHSSLSFFFLPWFHPLGPSTTSPRIERIFPLHPPYFSNNFLYFRVSANFFFLSFFCFFFFSLVFRFLVPFLPLFLFFPYF